MTLCINFVVFAFSDVVYDNGEEFCRGQTFELVSSGQTCFDFDPSVFSVASDFTPSFHIVSLSVLLLMSCPLLKNSFILLGNS